MKFYLVLFCKLMKIEEEVRRALFLLYKKRFIFNRTIKKNIYFIFNGIEKLFNGNRIKNYKSLA